MQALTSTEGEASGTEASLTDGKASGTEVDEVELIERIYAVMEDWEHVEPRLPPYRMFVDAGVDTEDVAALLVELRRWYRFEVTDYPECVRDVMDLVCGRAFKRLTMAEKTEVAMSAYNWNPMRRMTWWDKIKQLFN